MSSAWFTDTGGLNGQTFGKLRGRQVKATMTITDKGQWKPKIEVNVPVNAPLTVDLTREGIFTAIEKHLGAEELTVGHQGFDSIFYLHAYR